jgi:putative phage-type endonuclease
MGSRNFGEPFMNEHSSSFQNSMGRPFGIGGSDIGAILGLSPYKTAFQVWSEKVDQFSQASRDALHLRFGHHIEPFIAQEYEKVTGTKTAAHQQTLFHPKHPFLYGHIDRFVLAEGVTQPLAEGQVTCSTILECKSASIFNRHEWGEPGTDEIPPAYHAQCAWYMAITDCSRVDVAVLLGNQDFRIYVVKRDLELEARLIARALDFWQNHVLCKQAPKPETEADIRNLYSQETPDTEISADASFLETLFCYEEINAQANAITTKCEALKHEILIRMADAEKITYNGKVVATWKSSKGARRLDTKALSQAHPELADKFSFQAPGSRRFVFKGLS